MLAYRSTRIPVHKTRKARLNSHLHELQCIRAGVEIPKEITRGKFTGVDLTSFYTQRHLVFNGQVIS